MARPKKIETPIVEETNEIVESLTTSNETLLTESNEIVKPIVTTIVTNSYQYNGKVKVVRRDNGRVICGAITPSEANLLIKQNPNLEIYNG